MQLSLVGLSHKTAPVEIRERLAFDDQEISQALRSLIQYEDVSEALILSTCNRVEIVVDTLGQDEVQQFLCDYHNVSHRSINEYLYTLDNQAAIKHLFRVASSLDSMVVGEPQILGQVKEAYRVAANAGTVGGNIGSLMNRVFAVAKKVRTETGIANSAVSVGYAAVELARKIFGDLSGKSVMIIGASKMGELAAKHLQSAGVSMIMVTNRTFERAVELARSFEGAAIQFDHLYDHLAQSDIVISSTGSPSFVIEKRNAEQLIRRRKNKPIFLIDIAVPRDIDPAVNDIDNLFLYDIDDLQQVVDENLQERMKAAARAEQIVDSEVRSFCLKLEARGVVPTIRQLRETLETLRVEELSRHKKQLATMDESQLEAVDQDSP